MNLLFKRRAGLSQPRRWLRAHGFSMVELAISLVAIGLIASTAALTYGGMVRNGGGKLSADASLAAQADSVVAFVKARNRLPCPDTVGKGYESLSAGACPATTDVGWLPYLSMGLSQPADKDRSIYGAYRNPLADLGVSADLKALGIAAIQPTSNSFIYLTGDGTTTNGAEDCAARVASNPAFVILSSGEDRDGDGKRVDGIHRTLPASGRCFAAPSRGVDTLFDDRTIAVTSYALMAKLNQ